MRCCFRTEWGLGSDMVMTHMSPEVKELLSLLQSKFGLPEDCIDFTIRCGVNHVVEITTTYFPKGNQFPAHYPEEER